MAVFGILDSTEEDALRACRAAIAIHAAFAKAGDDFDARYDERPLMRTGISSGMAAAAAAMANLMSIVPTPWALCRAW